MITEKTTIPAYGDGIMGDTIIDMSIQCLACANLHKRMTSCRAFKNGIPLKILNGHFDHTKPFKNDNGIRFRRVEV